MNISFGEFLHKQYTVKPALVTTSIKQ